MNKYLIEGLDRLGKDTLIQGIKHRHGFHHVLHFSKPELLDCYKMTPDEKELELYMYQHASFANMFELLSAKCARLICNRTHLGECVYAPLYRGYSGDYVFDMERAFQISKNIDTRLILLTEDFDIAEHFLDDGESLGPIENRRKEQELFIAAFERSKIPNKRIVCVTDPGLGGFKPKTVILDEALL